MKNPNPKNDDPKTVETSNNDSANPLTAVKTSNPTLRVETNSLHEKDNKKRNLIEED